MNDSLLFKNLVGLSPVRCCLRLRRGRKHRRHHHREEEADQAPSHLLRRRVRPHVELGTDPVQDPLAYERSHVVVYLEGANLPSRVITATMEQKNRRFIPDLVVIPVGSTVSFPNLDEIFHNVFSLSKARSFDLGNYPMNKTKLVTFSKAGVVFVNCHLHPNMAAAIVVSPNQWSTKADGNGKFVLPQVPPGKYTIVAWHKTAGYFRQEITVTEKGKAGVEFLIPVDESAIGKGMSEK
jgi:plastocyanin